MNIDADRVVLQSCTGDNFEIPKKLALKSATIENLLSHATVNEEIPTIPLPNISTPCLAKVVEWLLNHQEDMKMTPEQEKDYQVVDEFDRKMFAKMDQLLHFEMINAANYLAIKRLLDNSCKLIAAQMVNQPIEKIREKFNIVNDYTPEEEEQIRRENAWLED